MNTFKNFPLKHLVFEDKKEIWIACNSSITAKGIPSLIEKYCPDYSSCLCCEDYLEKLKGQLEN
jgi:hypothetical protein